MKTDHSRQRLFNHVTHFPVERAATVRRPGVRLRHRHPGFAMEAGQSIAPCLDLVRVDLRLPVAEEIQVEGLVCVRTDDRDFLQYLSGVEQGAGQRAQPTGPAHGNHHR